SAAVSLEAARRTAPYGVHPVHFRSTALAQHFVIRRSRGFQRSYGPDKGARIGRFGHWRRLSHCADAFTYRRRGRAKWLRTAVVERQLNGIKSLHIVLNENA